jgi:lipopolysaccharide/colanic/teichoic acid biosynthesis glycosyltransferase
VKGPSYDAGVPDWIQRALALAGAVLTLPLMAILALAIKLDSPGPVIYSDTRVGEGGQLFRCHKLRTMRPRREVDSAVAMAEDPRVTRLGRLLRRLRLDELPQLWNVVRGSMRLVGPRPESPRFVDLSDPGHRAVFTVRPGITGLAQLIFTNEAAVIGRDDPEGTYRRCVLPAKVKVDEAYLRHRSTALDLWILAQTPRALFGRPIRLPEPLRSEVGTLVA